VSLVGQSISEFAVDTKLLDLELNTRSDLQSTDFDIESIKTTRNHIKNFTTQNLKYVTRSWQNINKKSKLKVLKQNNYKTFNNNIKRSLFYKKHFYSQYKSTNVKYQSTYFKKHFHNNKKHYKNFHTQKLNINFFFILKKNNSRQKKLNKIVTYNKYTTNNMINNHKHSNPYLFCHKSPTLVSNNDVENYPDQLLLHYLENVSITFNKNTVKNLTQKLSKYKNTK
jgi:hypothetical protein